MRRRPPAERFAISERRGRHATEVGALRSVAALTAGEVVNKGARFAATVVLARSLALDDFGLLNVGIAVAGILFVASGLGLPETGGRDVSVTPSRAGEVVNLVLGGRLVTLGALAIPVLLVVAATASEDLPAICIAIAMALMLATSVEWLLRGLERMGSVAAANAAGGGVVLAGAVVIVSSRPTAEVALIIFVAGEATVALITLMAAGLPRLPRPSLAGLRLALRRSWPLGASVLVVYSYYANLDTILLSMTRSAEEAGLYSAPYRLFLALNVIGTFAAYALMPRIARAVERGPEADRQAMQFLTHALVPLAGYGLVVLGAMEIGRTDVLRLLFGATFSGQDNVLLILCMAVPWYSVAFPVGYALIARDANRRFFAGAAVAGVLNLALNAALIPPFGTVGAAIATAAALVAGSVVWLVAHNMLTYDSAAIIAALLASSLGAATVLAWSGSGPAVGLITAGAGVIALTAAGLRLR